MTLHPDVLGIDVSKHQLDIFDPEGRTPRRIANCPAEAGQLARSLAGRDCLVVLEATGRYDGALRQALAGAGVRHARVNPEQARDFARAIGRRAKTDAVDARMLAELGMRLSPRQCPPADPERDRIAALSRRRDQLVAIRKQERNRRTEYDEAEMRADLEAHLAWLNEAITRLDASIEEAIGTSPALEQSATLLRSAPGVGPVTATIVIAAMPELGHCSPKAAAALGGLAPYNNDSGNFRGKRSVRGGRKRVRDALYMAAVSAARSKTRLGDFYRRLREAGKPPKVAFIALARKLLVILNAILRDRTPFSAA
jgi:transposase